MLAYILYIYVSIISIVVLVNLMTGRQADRQADRQISRQVDKILEGFKASKVFLQTKLYRFHYVNVGTMLL